MNGGDFAHGFVSGAASSLVATGMGSLTQGMDKLGQAIGTIGGGAFAGGVGASIAGGDFWDGFRNGAISAGLNHAVHAGVFGKGLAIAAVTGRTRHLRGPDAIAGALTFDASSGISMSAEGGGIALLVGNEKGFYSYTDIGMGAGLISVSGGLELVELYSSSSISEVGIKDFSGSRLEINVSGSILGLSVGGTGVVARHTNELGQRTGGITLGIGVTVAYDAVPPIIPIKVNGNVNYGATTIGDVRGIVPTLRESFKLR